MILESMYFQTSDGELLQENNPYNIRTFGTPLVFRGYELKKDAVPHNVFVAQFQDPRGRQLHFTRAQIGFAATRVKKEPNPLSA